MEASSLVLTSYADAMGRAMDMVANNVANINTTGFKRQGVQFDSLISRPTARVSDRIDFVIDRATYRDISPGPTHTTGNPLDIAIMGDGYFQVQSKQGTRYTRAGSFALDSEGNIITQNGDKVLGDGDQPITIPVEAEDVNISPDGVISGRSGTGTDITQFGKMKLVKFDREQDLQMIGAGLYSSKETPKPIEDQRMVQGALEGSNVSAVVEMTRMIDINRSYQQAMNLMGTEQQRIKDAISKLAKASA